MNDPQQIARKLYYEDLAGYMAEGTDTRDAEECIAIIRSAIEKATKEHQAEHDRLQAIIEKDTIALMAEREKTRVLGSLVDGFRKERAENARAAHASEQGSDTKRLDALLYETNTPLSKVFIAMRVTGGITLLCTREAIDAALPAHASEPRKASPRGEDARSTL